MEGSSELRNPAFEPGQGVVWLSPHDLIELRFSASALGLQQKKVLAHKSGGDASPFRGRGMEFAESRPYQAGDDIRTLDWRVTARTGKAHTKLFREERERAVLIAVDFRQSMIFATQKAFKSVIAAKAAAIIAWRALQRGDRLGSVLFADTHHKEIRPRLGKTAVLYLLQQMALWSKQAWETQSKHTVDDKLTAGAFEEALGRLRRVAKPGSLIVLLSDGRQITATARNHLMRLSRHNDVVFVHVHDKLESQLPPAGLYRVSDLRQHLSIDTSTTKARQQYHDHYTQRVDTLQQFCRQQRIRFLSLSTGDDVLEVLRQGFLQRAL